ncbi:hypothetical protein CFP56_011481, partial [Quercus suber]
MNPTRHLLRSPNLKRLVLPSWNQLTISRIQQALKMLFGTYSKNFFKIKCSFDVEFAIALVEDVPKLIMVYLSSIK